MTESDDFKNTNVIPLSTGQRIRLLRSLHARLMRFPEQEEVVATLQRRWPALFDGVSVGGHEPASHMEDVTAPPPRTVSRRPADDEGLTDRLTAYQEEVAGLKAALASNRHIGMAMGILMARRLCTEEQAFELLRTESRQAHRKLRDVAAEVIFSGDLPTPSLPSRSPHRPGGPAPGNPGEPLTGR